MKKTFIKSGKPIDAKTTSVGKKDIRNAAMSAIVLLPVTRSVSLYTRTMFATENIKGKNKVENSFKPKIFIESAVSAINPTLNGKIG
jgi:hypothetical protein